MHDPVAGRDTKSGAERRHTAMVDPAEAGHRLGELRHQH